MLARLSDNVKKFIVAIHTVIKSMFDSLLPSNVTFVTEHPFRILGKGAQKIIIGDI